MAKLQVAKVTLSYGKVVLIREMKVSDTEKAAQMVAQKASGDSNMLQILMQKALLQILLVQVDGKALTGMEKEDIDSLFKMGEYTQLLKVIGKMYGEDEKGKEPLVEFANASE